MSLTSINIHAYEGLQVSSEYPSNGNSITLRGPGKTEVTFYLPVEQWVLLRCLPKASDYAYAIKGKGLERDHGKADELARKYFAAWLESENNPPQDVDAAAPGYQPGLSEVQVAPTVTLEEFGIQHGLCAVTETNMSEQVYRFYFEGITMPLGFGLTPEEAKKQYTINISGRRVTHKDGREIAVPVLAEAAAS